MHLCRPCRDTERSFAEGDRVQMTAPYHDQKLANRELGTVEKIDGDGNLKLRMDSGREVEFNVSYSDFKTRLLVIVQSANRSRSAEFDRSR